MKFTGMKVVLMEHGRMAIMEMVDGQEAKKEMDGMEMEPVILEVSILGSNQEAKGEMDGMEMELKLMAQKVMEI